MLHYFKNNHDLNMANHHERMVGLEKDLKEADTRLKEADMRLKEADDKLLASKREYDMLQSILNSEGTGIFHHIDIDEALKSQVMWAYADQLTSRRRPNVNEVTIQ